jgi:hypothetical protein
MTLTDLEMAVIRRILEEHERGFEELREQFKQAAVVERHVTGVGFYTRFAVPEVAPRSAASSPVGNVSAQIEGLRHGAGFTLWLKNGRLTQLEGYSYDEPWWPTGSEKFTLT